MASEIYARTVAEALEKHLGSLEDSSIYWVTTTFDDNCKPNKILWPKEDQYGYLIYDGCNEGIKIEVTVEQLIDGKFQHNSYLTCKFLCGMSKAFTEAARVREFMDSTNFTAMAQTQA